MTDLTFGRMADSDGKALAGSSDTDFRLRYRGNILGAESINVSLAGGELNYAGTMRVHSFRMDNQTRLLTEFNNGNASIIEAGDNVTLASGSAIGFAPSPFSYGRQLAQGGNAVLRFTQSMPTDPALLPSAGNFSMGAFDYQWDGLYWDAPTGALMVNTTRAAFNDMRGGTDARNAQLALTARAPGLDAVGTRMVRRFGSVGAQSTALSLLGTPEANTGTFWSQEQPFATSTGFARDPIKTGASPAAASVNWLSLSDGGWEAGTPRGGVWVAPSYSYLSHQGDSSYTVQGASVTFGFDHFFTEVLYMGLALSLDYPRYDSDNAEVNGSGATGIFYGGMLLPLDVEVGFNASYGGMYFKQKRTVHQSEYHSDYNSKTLNFGTSIGRRFAPSENYALRPFADWNYFYSENSSHSERADIYGLEYESVRNAIHRLQAGLEGVWATDDMHLGLKAYWSGLRGDTGGTSASSFVLDPEANRFTAPVDGLDRDNLGLGVSAGVRLGGGTELRLEYSLLAGKTTTAHQGMVGLRYDF
ncbi:autotransporter outer membrane beta-barrel domain-containing protein [Desulfovibrio sp.]|uniref:autotransporter outer membrane beta-barrel domain-containing protein n=1 Tax=Desulfovibrio sp. TaxID=885 RepID=UPI0025BC0358|nr:autotransporter outer membrane beta-barrel domain-containing protein [Desulfovibrio sp.]